MERVFYFTMTMSSNLNKSSLAVLLCVAISLGMTCSQNGNKVSMPRDINTVKEAHTQELMAVPGVVGVYVGELNDHTPCIVVMVTKRTQEVEQKIPKTLEGHPVKVDETGVIRPMK